MARKPPGPPPPPPPPPPPAAHQPAVQHDALEASELGGHIIGGTILFLTILIATGFIDWSLFRANKVEWITEEAKQDLEFVSVWLLRGDVFLFLNLVAASGVLALLKIWAPVLEFVVKRVKP